MSVDACKSSAILQNVILFDNGGKKGKRVREKKSEEERERKKDRVGKTWKMLIYI